jgi:Dyp-type peroxidase family
MADSLEQEGIYYQKGASPPGFFTVLLLHAPENQTASSVNTLLEKLWQLYMQLKDGSVPELPGVQVDKDKRKLKVLLGFGAAAFDLPGALRSCPPDLRNFSFAEMKGGGPIAYNGSHEAAIRYAPELGTQPPVQFALQFTAKTSLAVEQAVVETAKLLQLEAGGAALEIVSFYPGSQRDDGRSWLGFHDGLSNLSADERPGVILISPTAPGEEWTRNGTYLAFARLSIALESWWTLDRAAQERLVGRDKLTGCPLVAFDNGTATAAAGCPLGGEPITATVNIPFRDAYVANPGTTLALSHVQRANHHFGPSAGPPSLRIYRQGYPFLEACDEAPHFRAGLNFVSFQDTPARLMGILTRKGGWLGTANFGGPDAPSTKDDLVKAYAAGMFLVPPLAEGERYPGAGALAPLPGP